VTDYGEFNSRMWDEWSAKKNIWTQPISQEDFLRSKQTELKIYLTPQKPVPERWFQGLGKRVLGGQLQAGFLIKDLYEDREPDNRLAKFTSLYIADLAVKL